MRLYKSPYSESLAIFSEIVTVGLQSESIYFEQKKANGGISVGEIPSDHGEKEKRTPLDRRGTGKRRKTEMGSGGSRSGSKGRTQRFFDIRNRTWMARSDLHFLMHFYPLWKVHLL